LLHGLDLSCASTSSCDDGRRTHSIWHGARQLRKCRCCVVVAVTAPVMLCSVLCVPAAVDQLIQTRLAELARAMEVAHAAKARARQGEEDQEQYGRFLV
jgi:hypothetical protein